MKKNHFIFLWLLFTCILRVTGYGQVISPSTDSAAIRSRLPADGLDAKTLEKLNSKYSSLSTDLTNQSLKMIDGMEKKELQLRSKLSLKDTMAAKKLFDDTKAKYDQLKAKLQAPATGMIPRPIQEYIPHLDSMQTYMHFLSQSPNGIAPDKLAQIQQLSDKLNQLQGKWQLAGEVQDFARQREQLLTDQLSKYGMGSQLTGMNKEVYYYQQQLSDYKKTFSDPSKMEQTALKIAGQLPVFQKFMQSNSYLGRLFPMPQNYGTPQALAGIPNSEDVGKMIAEKMGTADNKIDPQQYLQQQAQDGQGQLSALKDKVEQAGGGNSDVVIPRFTPNSQKTKSFLHRLEYGFNIQSQTKSSFLPATTQIAVTLGYKISDRATTGIGLAYTLGWGSDIGHIALSNEGLGLRSYLDVKAKGNTWITGGFEYNYIQAFSKLSEIENIDAWQKSALLGLTQKYKIGKRTGNVQLLFDFLAHYEVPKASSLKFRVGYSF